MKKTLLKTATVVLFTAAITGTGLAENMQGTYLNANLGATQFPGLTFKDSNNNNSLSLSSKLGVAAGLALGSQNENLRVELAANYWENHIKRASIHPSSSIYPNLDTTDGTGSITLAMVNGYYDFNATGAFTPYLGLGVGAARFRSDMIFYNNSNTTAANARISHNDIAYQGIVGAAWDLGPCVKANIDYRYLFTGPQRMNVNYPLSVNNFRSNYKNHRVSVGLTYYVQSI